MSSTIFSTADAAQAIADRRAAQENAQVEGDDALETEEIETGEGPEDLPEADESDPSPADSHDEDGAPEEAPAIAAPSTWPKDRLEDWDELPESAKQAWISRDDEVHRFKSETGREAAEAKRKAEEAATRKQQEYADRISRLDPLIASLEEKAESKWKKIDQAEWARLSKDEPAEYVALRAEYEADAQAHQRATQAKAQAKAEQDQTHQKEQFDLLLERNPQYRGAEGLKKLSDEAREVETFARNEIGLDDDFLRLLPAKAYEALRDTMAYRKAAKTATQPSKQPAQKTVKPSARPAAGDTARKSVEQAKQRLKDLSKASAPRSKQDAAFADFLALKRQKAR